MNGKLLHQHNVYITSCLIWTPYCLAGAHSSLSLAKRNPPINRALGVYRAWKSILSKKKQSKTISEVYLPSVGSVSKGKSLEHPIFGLGKVIDIAQWESGDVTINIEFEKHGSKWLALEHANLAEPAKKGFWSRLFS